MGCCMACGIRARPTRACVSPDHDRIEVKQDHACGLVGPWVCIVVRLAHVLVTDLHPASFAFTLTLIHLQPTSPISTTPLCRPSPSRQYNSYNTYVAPPLGGGIGMGMPFFGGGYGMPFYGGGVGVFPSFGISGIFNIFLIFMLANVAISVIRNFTNGGDGGSNSKGDKKDSWDDEW